MLRLRDVYRKCLYVTAAAWILGLAVPWGVAELSSAMEGSHVVEKLKHPEAKARYETERACRSYIIAQEAALVTALKQGQAVGDGTVGALSSYEKLRAMCDDLESHVSVTGYSDSNVKWLWAGLLLFLGLAVWVLPVPSMFEADASGLQVAIPTAAERKCRFFSYLRSALSSLRVFIVYCFSCRFFLRSALPFLGVLIVYRFSPWWRNFEATCRSREYDAERKLYSWTNLDVDLSGFIVQEGLASCVAVLLVLTWKKWNAEHLHIDAYLQSTTELSLESVRAFSVRVSRAFHVCIVASALLCAAFVPYTRFFWRVVKDMGDERYFSQAVVVHFLWLVTWLVIALPFCRLWVAWEETRNRILCSKNLELAALAGLEPVSRSHGALSAIVALAAALYPLVG